MPIQHAVLALLARGPSYGYELKASFEQTIGPQWGELNIGHLYQVLDRLKRDGYVSTSRLPQADRPDRMVYEMTDRGREELDHWLGQPFTRTAGFRDDFFLKLLAAASIDLRTLRRVIKNHRQSKIAELRTLHELRIDHADDPLVGLLIEAASLQTEATLRLTDLAEERSGALVRSSAKAHSRPSQAQSAENATRPA